MKAYKIELLVIDHDNIGEEAIVHELTNAIFANDCIAPEVKCITEKDIGKWSDDHLLNRRSTRDVEYKRLFGVLKLKEKNQTQYFAEINGIHVLHREDGPAVELDDFCKAWYFNGKLHRIDGPAVEWANGDKSWYVNGKRHRLDGPATENVIGVVGWYVFIEIRGKRFKEEIYYQNKEGLEISRDSRLVRKDIGYEVPVRMEISKASAQIVPLAKGWYLNISVELSAPKVTMKEYALKFKNEGSILGIDLGQRTAVSYAHLKQSDQGTVTIENDKSKAEKCKFNVVEVGSLNESFLVRGNKKTVGKANHFKYICRLSYKNRDAGDNEKQIWLDVRKMCMDIGIELPEREVPVSAMKLYEDIVYYTKRYVRHTKKWDETDNFLKDLYPKLLNSRIGGLSFAWISLLMNFKSCFQCFVRRANDNNQNINFDNVILALTEKANNVRRERARISANLIVQKAIEIKKVEGRNPMIVIEKLDIQASQSNTSFLNERTHNWCSRRIVDLVKQLSEEFGFVVKEVNPRNSSMEDVKTGEWKPRFDIVNVNDLEKKYHYNFLANTFLKPNGQRETARRCAVLNKLNYLKVEPNVDNLILVLKKEAIDGKVYSPSVFGQWYYSDVWGWIDSDQHAAIILASRGAKLLFGWYRERQDIENAENAKKLYKSLRSNGVMAKNGTDGRSQDVSLLAKTSWGKMNGVMKILEEKEWSPSREV